MRVIDGVHRVRAALLNRIEKIPARILDCDETAAFVLAVRANVTHGLPLSQSDRAAAAVRIITYRPEWSDRAVAAVTGLSDKTVSRIRGRSTAETSQSHARIGRDGRIRPLDTGASRQQAAEMINEKPEVGLREVARATGLSVATVRDVRQRIGRGEDPVPGRYRSSALESSAIATATKPPRLTAGGVKRKDVFADRNILLAKLTQDPSLRFSETGRQIVRWLHQHSVDADGVESLVGGLPDHWAPVVASLARGCARTWLRIAEQLEQRAEGAVCGRQ
jgi:ParB-like chromosome segregation protein Spo0J